MIKFIFFYSSCAIVHSIYVNWFDSNVPMPNSDDESEIRAFLTHNTSHNHFTHGAHAQHGAAGAEGAGAGDFKAMMSDPSHRVPMVALE